MNDFLRNEIIADIAEAFSEVRRGNTTLHEAYVIDRCGSDSDCSAARAQDPDKRWQEVPDADIESHSSALCFLCPGSFRYDIAAYMVWSLRHYRTSDSSSSDFTIYALTLNTNKSRDSWKLSRFALFTPRQAHAISRFLEFMVEHGDGYADDLQAKLALDAYWNEHAKIG